MFVSDCPLFSLFDSAPTNATFHPFLVDLLLTCAIRFVARKETDREKEEEEEDGGEEGHGDGDGG